MPTEGEECINAFQQYYSRPMEIPKKESLRLFLFNPKTKAVFGRTGSSWGKSEGKRIWIWDKRPWTSSNRIVQQLQKN